MDANKGAELGQAQLELRFDLKKFRMFYWGLQIKVNNFYFGNIALLGLNQTRLSGWVDGGVGGWPSWE